MSVCVYVEGSGSERELVRGHVYARVCLCVACYLSGCSGERKQLQGKFWGKWLSNPNLQVGMHTKSLHPSLLPRVDVCIGNCLGTQVE